MASLNLLVLGVCGETNGHVEMDPKKASDSTKLFSGRQGMYSWLRASSEGSLGSVQCAVCDWFGEACEELVEQVLVREGVLGGGDDEQMNTWMPDV